MIKNPERGVSLIITFFVLVIVLAVVLSISIILYSEIKIIRNIGDSVVAFYAADSGIEKTLYYDRKMIPLNADPAGSKRGICSICESSEVCLSETPLQDGGCNPATCENCRVEFETDLVPQSKSYKIVAEVTQNNFPGTAPISRLNITSTGSYMSVLGADAIKRAIQLDTLKIEGGGAWPTISAAVSPVNVSSGTAVVISAVISGSNGISDSSVAADIFEDDYACRRNSSCTRATLPLNRTSGGQNSNTGDFQSDPWIDPNNAQGVYYVTVKACDATGAHCNSQTINSSF